MTIRRPAMLAATAALALVPALGMIVPAQAQTRPLVAATETATPAPTATVDPQALITLVLAAFPANIQGDVQVILSGDYIGGLTALFNDATKLTPEQLTDIATKLQALLGQLPTTQATQLKAQLKNGLTKQETIQVLLAPR